MNGGSAVNKVFAIIFGLIGLFMVWMGMAFLATWPQNQTEWVICLGALFSGVLLIYSAWSTWKKGVAQDRAERAESARLQRHKQTLKTKGEMQERSAVGNEPGTVWPQDASTNAPQILATWIYPKKEWDSILTRLAEKTRKEELFTAVWFPVVFALVFFAMWWLGAIIGLAFGWFYVWFRTNSVKKNFKIPTGKLQSEVVISDAYMNVNGHFVHYGDGRYFLKELNRHTDGSIGDHLHFVIGWFTSKGLPAQLDLYLPIPAAKNEEAEYILQKFKQSKS